MEDTLTVVVGADNHEHTIPSAILCKTSGLFRAHMAERRDKMGWTVANLFRNRVDTSVIHLPEVSLEQWRCYLNFISPSDVNNGPTFEGVDKGIGSLAALLDAMLVARRLDDATYLERTLDNLKSLVASSGLENDVQPSAKVIFDKLCTILTAGGHGVDGLHPLLLKLVLAEQVNAAATARSEVQRRNLVLESTMAEATMGHAEKEGQLRELYELLADRNAANNASEAHIMSLRSRLTQCEEQLQEAREERDHLREDYLAVVARLEQTCDIIQAVQSGQMCSGPNDGNKVLYERARADRQALSQAGSAIKAELDLPRSRKRRAEDDADAEDSTTPTKKRLRKGKTRGS